LAFFGREGSDEVADCPPSVFEGALGGLAQQVLELGEDLFDWIEVGTVGRQKQHSRASRADGLRYGLAFMAAQIVEDDEIARSQGWNEDLFDMARQSLGPQPGEEGRRFTMAVGNARREPPFRAPTAQRRHVRLGPAVRQARRRRRQSVLPARFQGPGQTAS
jgi:hypothetical protein